MNAESNFYNLLEEVFCGKRINGTGGYVNLLKIKHLYYESILAKFKSEVKSVSVINGKFKEEFFDKLYNFFEKYFSEAGSVYFVNTPRNKNVYEQVYSNNEDVTLFYKTNMLYYVKTDTIFDNATINLENGVLIHFDVSELENRKNNEKKKIEFNFKSADEMSITISVSYAKGNSKNSLGQICKEAKKAGVTLDESHLEDAVKSFKKQMQVDFFINKNATKFLNEQLAYYMHDILLNEENSFDAGRLEKIKLINKFAEKLISFVGQFEDELVRIWDKPKFSLDGAYLVSVKLISDAMLEVLLRHENIDKQVEKWKEQKQLIDVNKVDFEVLRNNPYLLLDTKFFKEVENQIINAADAKVKGLVINSDNYQALNTLEKKYEKLVDIIYIDPPYNTDADSFEYVDGYESSSYLSMMYDRLVLAKKMLTNQGIIFISINDKELYELKLLCDKIFGKANFVCNFIRKIKAGRTTAGSVDLHHDYMLCYTKSKKAFDKSNNLGTDEIEMASNVQMVNGIPYKKRTPLYKVDGGRKGSQYRVYNPYLNIEHYPPIYYNASVRFGWFLGQENYNMAVSQEPEGFNEGYEWQIIFIKDIDEWERIKEQKKKSNPSLRDEDIYSFYFMRREKESHEVKYNHISSLFAVTDTKYNNATGTSELNTTLDNVKSEGEWISDIHPKSISLIKDIITYSTRYKDKVVFMDFFGGSGTSGEAAISFAKENPDIDLDYILVEVNDYSDTVLKKRIEKAHQKIEVEGIIKYYDLEQYADALRSVCYNQEQSYISYTGLEPYQQYVFYSDKKLLKNIVVGDGYEINLSRIYDNIDINETISNLMGLFIIRYEEDGIVLDRNGVEYKVKTNTNTMNNEEKKEFLSLISPLLWWGV